jgi:glyoxylase-like metal-dependent hydrolase (beta-lactamase superfamily II)
MQLFPNVHIIEAAINTRPLQLPLLIGDKVVLIDTGVSSDPQKVIFPYMKKIGLTPKDLDLVITTHSDLDHCGGNAAVKRANPNVTIACGEADRFMIESPKTLFSYRYDHYHKEHDIFYNATAKKWIRETLGEPQPVDVTFTGGEVIRLSKDWLIKILHTPGHSYGHLAVLDLKHHAVYTGDAAHGSVYLDLQGNPALCPTYLYVETYLSTARQLGNLDVDTLCGCHWHIKRGHQIQEFLDETRGFVELADNLILQQLREEKKGATMKELIDELSPKLGGWSHAIRYELAFAFSGHLDRFERLKIIKAKRGTKPMQYVVS